MQAELKKKKKAGKQNAHSKDGEGRASDVQG